MARGKAEAFVAAWLTHSTHADIAKAMGMKPAAVNAYAVRLRKRGVKLPSKHTGGPGAPCLDIDALNALIEKAESQ